MADINEAERANAYKTIFENPFYTDATDRVKAALIAQLEKTTVGDVKALERIHLMLTLLNTLHGTITRTIKNGDIDRKSRAELAGEKPSIVDYFKA